MAPKSQKANTGKKVVKPAAAPKAKATAATTRSKVTKKTATKAAPKAAAAKPPVKTAAAEKAAPAKAAKTSKAAPKKTAAQPDEAPAKPSSKKRARDEPAAEVKPTKKVKLEPAINSTPSTRLDVYVFGSGELGELGLGSTVRDNKKPKNVKRPRLNDLLDAKTVGVVQIASGGMHCVALTHDQKILTWGVNDNGALGRDTTWEAPTRDADADSDSEDDDDLEGINPRESTPAAIPAEYFDTDRKFVQVAATDSASFALTEDGFVYGWGTFRGTDGAIGFFTDDAAEAARTKNDEKKYQRRPALVPGLKKIVYLAAGGNHVQALDEKGNVFSWGCGEQRQLGRRVVERNRALALTPALSGLSKRIKVASISAGAYHSFAVDTDGHVYAWGLNNFAQTGISTGAGEGEAIIEKPTVVESLKDYKISEIKGGLHHSLACTEDGKLIVWGRCDDAQAGISLADVPKDDLLFDSREKPRILQTPTVVPAVDAVFVTAGIDNSFAITKAGQVYSWGFSSNYRTGLGTEDSINEATVIENTALKGKKLTYAGCGGQFSVLAGPAGSA